MLAWPSLRVTYMHPVCTRYENPREFHVVLTLLKCITESFFLKKETYIIHIAVQAYGTPIHNDEETFDAGDQMTQDPLCTALYSTNRSEKKKHYSYAARGGKE